MKFKSLKYLLGLIHGFFLFYVVFPSVISAQISALTMEKFNQIEDGMSYSQVVSILGQEGTLQIESGSGEYKFQMYTWIDRKVAISVGFQNNQMEVKSQFGLGGTSPAPMTVTPTPPPRQQAPQQAAPPPATAKPPAAPKSNRPFYYGTFWKCQVQTMEVCKKSGRIMNEWVRFASNGMGLYFFQLYDGRYKNIHTVFKWAQQGNVASASNKSSTYIHGLQGDVRTSETFPANSFELIDDFIIRSDTGVIYLRKGNSRYDS